MNRKKFIKKALLGLGAVVATPLIAKEITKNSENEKLREQVGFNHLPNQENKSMNSILHKASTRGHADHGWLDTHHTFSFANYYNPDRMNFGVLRVLNDDIVTGGKGFATHPHENMEIISIPLEGDLEHQDSMGNKHVIKTNDIQVMSAGTGIYHSEYNRNPDKITNFLQIWVIPNKKGVTPRYDQITLKNTDVKNQFYQILSPNADDEGVWIHQNAWFHIAEFDKDKSDTYELKDKTNGVYIFVLEGDVTIAGQSLNKRDGIGIWDTDKIDFTAVSNTKVLLMEVPMSV